jgi:hypothetical protein
MCERSLDEWFDAAREVPTDLRTARGIGVAEWNHGSVSSVVIRHSSSLMRTATQV